MHHKHFTYTTFSWVTFVDYLNTVLLIDLSNKKETERKQHRNWDRNVWARASVNAERKTENEILFDNYVMQCSSM